MPLARDPPTQQCPFTYPRGLYVKVAGVWRYVYRAVDGYGQVIDVYVSSRRDITAARHFFNTAITGHGQPDEVVTDRAAALANVIEELLPAALHNSVKYANNRNGDYRRSRVHPEPALRPL